MMSSIFIGVSFVLSLSLFSGIVCLFICLFIVLQKQIQVSPVFVGICGFVLV